MGREPGSALVRFSWSSSSGSRSVRYRSFATTVGWRGVPPGHPCRAPPSGPSLASRMRNASRCSSRLASVSTTSQRGSQSANRQPAARGGLPTFLGTVVGNSFVNETLFLAFLALAAGSILYVIIQLLKVANRMAQPEILMWGLVGGLFLGFATDYVLVAAGA